MMLGSLRPCDKTQKRASRLTLEVFEVKDSEIGDSIEYREKKRKQASRQTLEGFEINESETEDSIEYCDKKQKGASRQTLEGIEIRKSKTGDGIEYRDEKQKRAIRQTLEGFVIKESETEDGIEYRDEKQKLASRQTLEGFEVKESETEDGIEYRYKKQKRASRQTLEGFEIKESETEDGIEYRNNGHHPEGESGSETHRHSYNLRSSRCFNEVGRRGDGEVLDRFSSLTNDTIGLILSFLPTKEAFRTCVLSTQWVNHWILVKKLDFEYQSSPEPYRRNVSPTELNHMRDNQIKFIAFVTRVIQLTKNSPLQQFSLKFYPKKTTQTPEWILNTVVSVLSHGLRELDVFTRLPRPTNWMTKLPSYLFHCTTLEVLKLGSGFRLNLPFSFCLPKLKILSLHRLFFIGKHLLSRFISGCPLLEDLSVVMAFRIDVLHVSAPALETFALDGMEIKEVVLDTPRLASLSLGDKFVVRFEHPLTLVRAELGPVYYLYNGWIKALNHMRNVQSFRLVGVPIELASLGDYWPEFPNLKYLCIGSECVPNWLSVLCLLNKTPGLETLVFDKGLPMEPDALKTVETPPCLLSQVKVVIIQKFEGKDREIDAIMYFKSRAKVLKELEIHVEGTEPELIKKELLRKIKRSRKASRQCRIMIS